MLSYKITVSGDVQGVGFRSAAFRTASRLNLRGYARNNDDGTVGFLVQGPKDGIDQFIDWCRIGSVSSRVQAVSFEKVEEDEQKGFRIL